LYRNGKIEDLGTFPTGTASWGHAVNDSDEVTGFATTGNGYQFFAFLHSRVMKNLGTLPDAAGGSSNGIGINNHGDVVGAADAALGPDPTYIGTYAFLCSYRSMKIWM
jgi:hypothetical protein